MWEAAYDWSRVLQLLEKAPEWGNSTALTEEEILQARWMTNGGSLMAAVTPQTKPVVERHPFQWSVMGIPVAGSLWTIPQVAAACRRGDLDGLRLVYTSPMLFGEQMGLDFVSRILPMELLRKCDRNKFGWNWGMEHALAVTEYRAVLILSWHVSL